MKMALYVRVSTERQAERGTIGSQLQVLRERVTADGDELVSEYVDDGHSGARLVRPALDALRDAAEGGLFEAVWCLSPDRLARAYAYQVLALDELARFGVTVLFTDSAGLPADDPEATLLTQVQGVIAEYEKAKIAERYRRGKLFRARAGEITTWESPYGYWRVPRSTATGPAHLEIYESEAAVVRRIFTDRLNGLTAARSAAGSTPTRCDPRPGSPPGIIPPCLGCCATRPTSAGSISTAPNRSPTGSPPAATAKCPATPTCESRSTAPVSSTTRCSKQPRKSPPTTRNGARAAPKPAPLPSARLRRPDPRHHRPARRRPKQQLLRLLIEDVRVTGCHVEIRLRIALDPPDPSSPATNPDDDRTPPPPPGDQCQRKTVCVPLPATPGPLTATAHSGAGVQRVGLSRRSVST